MNDSVPAFQPGVSAPAPSFDPVKALAAVGDPYRWKILKLLAGGRAMSSAHIAALHDRKSPGVAKHLRILLRGGIVDCKIGEDRRMPVYFIPRRVRQNPGVLDYGDFTLRLPEALGLNDKD
jgi:predicted transcriptional regulator